MEISLLGIPWYRESDYTALKQRFTDGANLHSTYAGWLAAAEVVEEKLLTTGAEVVRVEIEPDSFLAWCELRNISADAKARTSYANQIAHELYLADAEIEEAWLAAQEDVKRRYRLVTDVVGRFVVPIFRIDESDIPDFEGTGILVRLQDRNYLLTAAHVLDACTSGVFLPDYNNAGEVLTGDRVVTGLKVGQSRAEDQIDIGFVRLSSHEAELIGHDRFFDLTLTIDRQPDEDFVCYVAYGYPVKDQVVDKWGRSIETAATSFLTGLADEKAYRFAKADPRTSVLFSYKRQNILHNRTQGSPPDFRKGMSGGGIWPISLEEEYSAESPPPLAGMMIERPRGFGPAILATRGYVLREFIRRFDT